MKTGIFSISIAILLIAYILIGLYFYGPDTRALLWPLTFVFNISETRPSPMGQSLEDETAGWKTYRNLKYGFELKYRPDWGVTARGLADGEEEISINDARTSGMGDYELLINVISRDQAPDPDTLETWARDYFGKIDYIIPDKFVAQVGGKPAVMVLYEGTSQSPASVTTILYWDKGKTLEFSCIISARLADTTGICDKMLESIRFLSPADAR